MQRRPATTWYVAMKIAAFFKRVYFPQRLVAKSQRTVAQYRETLEFFTRHAGDVDLAELSDELVAGWLAELVGGGMTAPTANKHRRHLLALWRFAKRRKLVEEGPDVDALPEMRRTPEAYTLEELERILTAAAEVPGRICDVPADLWWRGLVLVIFDTGLRITPAVLAPRAGLDLEAETLRIPAELQKQRADQWFRLHPQTIELLGRIADEPARQRLFPWPYDGDWHRSTVPDWSRRRSWKVLNGHFRKILDAADVQASADDKHLWHKIRKSTASYTTSKAGLEAAQYQLGHSSPSVTVRYLDPRIVTRVQAADVLPRPALPDRPTLYVAGGDAEEKPKGRYPNYRKSSAG